MDPIPRMQLEDPTVTAWLDAWQGRLPLRVQKLTVGADRALWLELYGGEKCGLWLEVGATSWSAAPARPAAFEACAAHGSLQALLRKELLPSRWVTLDADAPTGTLVLRFEGPGGQLRSLTIERSAQDGRLVLLSGGSAPRVLSVVAGALRPRDGRDLRRGQPYVPPAPSPDPRRSRLPFRPAGSPDAAQVSAAESRERTGLVRQLRQEEKRGARLLEGLTRDLQKHGDPEGWLQQGEALKAVLMDVRRGRTEVQGLDAMGAPITITLDPARDGPENLALLFHRARRAREARSRVAPRLAAAKARLEATSALRSLVADAGEGLPLEEALQQARRFVAQRDFGPGARRKASAGRTRKAWRSFQSAQGVLLRVGRSARDNDELTFHHARGNDLWVHARGAPGSHVIVALEGEREPPLELLLDAAHLALWFSPQRHDARGDVQYARRKHVKKPGRGVAPGFVHVHGEGVLHVRVEPERIQRLLAGEIPA